MTTMSEKNSSSSSSPTGDLQILDAAYIPACAKVMAQAFSDCPSYNYIFQGTAEYRMQALEWLFTKNLRLTVGKCPSVLRGILDSEDQVVCCFLWTPSAYADLSTWEMIQAGMWLVPFKFGFSTLSRLLNLLGAMESATGKIERTDDQSKALSKSPSTNDTESAPYIMLERMVVRPDHQGKGLGSKALKTTLDEELKKEGSVEIHFETQEDRNVRFYSRLGFQVTNSEDYYDDDPMYKFRSWHMMQRT